MRTDIDLHYFRQRLEQRLKELTDNQTRIEPVALDQARVGRLTRMDAMQQQAMARAADNLVQGELRRIRIALDRLKTGDYGYCMHCDEDIALGRLRADPGALTCIACAQAQEKQQPF